MVAAESLRIVDEDDEAPSFELPGTDGETYRLDSFADHDALLVVFTCNHCPYAKAKESALNAIAADYDDVAVVGINPNDPEQYPDDSFEKMQDLSTLPAVGYRTCPMPAAPVSDSTSSCVNASPTSPISTWSCCWNPSCVTMPADSWPRCWSAYSE
jgi:thiol-disulfide isomerase/thioredoxin